jgi:hypothetical protein
MNITVSNLAETQLLTNNQLLTNMTDIAWETMSVAEPTERQRGERLQIMLDGVELSAVDEFRFKKRMPSRAAAVRELLKRGLAAEGFLTAPVGARSSDFGVTGKTPAGR